MLSLNQTFDDTRNIKVLVVPIGSNSLFDNHFQVVSRLRDVPFYELNRPVNKNTNPAFKFFNWNNGNLLFDYLRYDRVARGPGDLDNFQSSKRVLMIMGLINYPELGDSINRIEEEMDYFSRRHPNILLRRLFVFNFSFDVLPGAIPVSPPRGLSDDPNSLVIFPPEGTCEGGTSMVDVHLNEVMSHAAVRIITSLEKQMEFCEECRTRNTLPNNFILSTNYDELDELTASPGGPSSTSTSTGSLHRMDMNANANTTSRNSSMSLVSNMTRGGGPANSSSVKPLQALIKKKPTGRIRKWMGDLSLQVCSPIDAVENYIPAIAECRNNGDNLWLAGALDGYACAVLLLLQQVAQGVPINIEDIIGKDLRTITNFTSPMNPVDINNNNNNSTEGYGSVIPSTTEEKAYRLAEERACEAISIYAKSIVFCTMEVEATLRLARMYENCEIELPNKEQMILDYVMRAVAVPGLNSQQSIECILEGALIFHRIGLKKKYGFFLYIAALLSAENDNYSVAHALIQYSCHEFGLHTGTEDASPAALTSTHEDHSVGVVQPNKDQIYVENVGQSWASMRTVLLSNAVLMAREHGDGVAASRFLSSLMRLMSDLELRQKVIRSDWATVTQKYFNLDAFDSNSGNNSVQRDTSDKTGQLVRNGSISQNHAQLQQQQQVQALTEDSLRKNDAKERSISTTEREGGFNLHIRSPSRDTSFTERTSSISQKFGPSASQYRSNKALGVVGADYLNDTTPSKNRLLFPLLGNGRQSSAEGSITSSANPSVSNVFRSPLAVRNTEANSASKRQSIEDILLNPNGANNSANLATDFANVANATVEGLRSFSVPKIIPNKLIAMAHRSKEGSEDSSNKFSRPTALGSNGGVGMLIEKRPHELIRDKIKRHLNNDPQLLKKHMMTSSASAYEYTSGIASSQHTANVIDPAQLESNYISDIMANLSTLLQTTFIPTDQQLDILDLFTTLNKQLDVYCDITLPIQMVCLRPLQLKNQYTPYLVVDAPGIQTARQGLALLHENVTKITDDAVSPTDTANSENPSAKTTSQSEAKGALFYDPFAAARARAKKQTKTQDTILWSKDCSECTVVAVFKNPLAVPITLTNVLPVIEVIHNNSNSNTVSSPLPESSTKSNNKLSIEEPNQTVTDMYRLYPKPVVIPANCVHFEVEMKIKPLQDGISFRFTGVHVFMHNAGRIIRIDDKGDVLAIENRSNVSTPASFPYKAVETKPVKKNIGTSSVVTAISAKERDSQVLRGMATNIVKIVSSAPLWIAEPSWTDLTVHNKHRDVATATTTSLEGVNVKDEKQHPQHSHSNTIDKDSDHWEPLTLSLHSGETRREAINIKRLIGANLEDIHTNSSGSALNANSSTSSSASSPPHIADYKVTLTQLNPLGEKKRITSVALDYHATLQPAKNVSSQDTTQVEVDPFNKVTTKVIDVVTCCELVSPSVSNNNNTSNNNSTSTGDGEVMLYFDFHYTNTAITVEIEFEIICQAENAVGRISELNRYYDASTQRISLSVKNTDTLSDILKLSQNNTQSDLFTFYSRKVKVVVNLIPRRGVLLSDLRMVNESCNAKTYELVRVVRTLSNGTYIPQTQSSSSHGGVLKNIEVLSENYQVIYQFTNDSAYPVYISNSKEAITEAITTNATAVTDSKTVSNTYGVINYTEFNSDSSSMHKVILSVIPPHSIYNVVINYPYSAYNTEFSHVAEYCKVQWGFVDPTCMMLTATNNDSNNNNKHSAFNEYCIRYGNVTIDNPNALCVVGENNAISVKATDDLVSDMMRYRPPLQMTVSLTIPTYSDWKAIDTTCTTYRQVPLMKFTDISINLTFLRNHFYNQYYCSSSSSSSSSSFSFTTDKSTVNETSNNTILQIELCLIIVSTQESVVIQKSLFSDNESTNAAIRKTLIASQNQQHEYAKDCYILSGRAHSTHSFTSSVMEIEQKLRLCFIVQGSYAIYALIRYVDGEDWWTLPEPIRVVAY